MVAPSNSSFVSGKLFVQEERKFLMKVCGSVVTAGVISKPVVKEMVGKEEEGRSCLKSSPWMKLLIDLSVKEG